MGRQSWSSPLFRPLRNHRNMGRQSWSSPLFHPLRNHRNMGRQSWSSPLFRPLRNHRNMGGVEQSGVPVRTTGTWGASWSSPCSRRTTGTWGGRVGAVRCFTRSGTTGTWGGRAGAVRCFTRFGTTGTWGGRVGAVRCFTRSGTTGTGWNGAAVFVSRRATGTMRTSSCLLAAYCFLSFPLNLQRVTSIMSFIMGESASCTTPMSRPVLMSEMQQTSPSFSQTDQGELPPGCIPARSRMSFGSTICPRSSTVRMASTLHAGEQQDGFSFSIVIFIAACIGLATIYNYQKYQNILIYPLKAYRLGLF